jgi:hypothetical protein
MRSVTDALWGHRRGRPTSSNAAVASAPPGHRSSRASGITGDFCCAVRRLLRLHRHRPDTTVPTRLHGRGRGFGRRPEQPLPHPSACPADEPVVQRHMMARKLSPGDCGPETVGASRRRRPECRTPGCRTLDDPADHPPITDLRHPACSVRQQRHRSRPRSVAQPRDLSHPGHFVRLGARNRAGSPWHNHSGELDPTSRRRLSDRVRARRFARRVANNGSASCRG